MVDRVIVYDGALPQSTDILNTNKFAMIGQAFASRAAFGINTVVNGLAASQASPTPNMTITVAPGSIYAVDEVDATAYGDLGIDAAFVVKQGIQYLTQTLTLTAPSIVGFSRNYIVQAQLLDVDAGSTVLPYFNAANPSQPFSGPTNSGSSQLTLRTVQCVISLAQGVDAATGSQTDPTLQPGAVGLYRITIANGQTQVFNAGIVLLPTAPFFPTLPQIPAGVQNNQWVYANDTSGVANTIVASVSPPPLALTPGLVAVIKLANTVTGATTLNLNGFGAVPVHRATGSPLSSGDITSGQIVSFLYDGTAFQIMNFTGATTGSTTNNFNSFAIPFGTDAGTVNAMSVATFAPTVGALSAGLTVLVKALNTNTGPCTLNASGLGAVNILENQISLLPGAIVAGQMVLLTYDGTFWQKINARNMFYSFDVATPPAVKIPMQVGDQLNITFENVTSVPFNVATVPGIYEVEMVVTINSSLSVSCGHRVNDAQFTGLFSNFVTQNSDSGVTAPPYVNANPNAFINNGFLNEFGVDLFQGPLTHQDTINAIGPILVRMTFCTVTAAKMCRWHGGCFGGPCHGHSFFNDNVTSWTSLGTFVVYKDVHHFGTTQATISGLAYVKRLA